MKRSVVGFVVTALLVLAAPAVAKDYAQMARNIIPSVQYGGVPVPPGGDRQARMYDGLTPLFNHVGRNDLFHFFKSERLGTGGQGALTREAVPRAGVRLMRDRFHVPHIYGRSNDDVTFGAGWVTAEDRELLLEQARYNGRVAALGIPGLSAIELITALRSFKPSAEAETVLHSQVRLLRRYGRRGRQEPELHAVEAQRRPGAERREEPALRGRGRQRGEQLDVPQRAS